MVLQNSRAGKKNLGRKEGTLLENEDLGPLQAGGEVKTAIAKLRDTRSFEGAKGGLNILGV